MSSIKNDHFLHPLADAMADISKEMKTKWKGQLKLLKSKDEEKKTQGLEYTRSDPVFLISGGAFAPFMGIIGRSKVRKNRMKNIALIYIVIIE